MRGMKLAKSIEGAVVWLEQGGSVAGAFKDALEAGGVITEDLMVVSGAVTAFMHAGLEREAMILLIQAKCKNQKNGHPPSVTTIGDVLDAMVRLHEFIQPPPAPSKAAR